MEEIIKTVRPCGHIKIGYDEYFLMYPTPLTRDWESDNFLRFSVVPKIIIRRNDEDIPIYPHVRHVVYDTNSSITRIEYSHAVPPILVLDFMEIPDEE